MARAQAIDRMQDERDSRFHVKSAWPAEAPTNHPARHVSQSSQRIDSVNMSQQQHWFTAALSSEIHLQVIPKLLRTMKF